MVTCLLGSCGQSSSPSQSAGILQTLCEIVKVASPVSILAASSHFQSLLASCESIKATGGGLFAKYRVKLAGRLAVLRLTSDVNDGEAGEALEAVIQEMLEGLENEVGESPV